MCKYILQSALFKRMTNLTMSACFRPSGVISRRVIVSCHKNCLYYCFKLIIVQISVQGQQGFRYIFNSYSVDNLQSLHDDSLTFFLIREMRNLLFEQVMMHNSVWKVRHLEKNILQKSLLCLSMGSIIQHHLLRIVLRAKGRSQVLIAHFDVGTISVAFVATIFFGCESSPISRNVCQSVSQ